MGISSRNSEVIHAGIYYPVNSLKARFCVEGRELLYEICAGNQIPHKKIGKLIIPPQFDHVSDFDGGLAGVWADKTSSYIDMNGKIVFQSAGMRFSPPNCGPY